MQILYSKHGIGTRLVNENLNSESEQNIFRDYLQTSLLTLTLPAPRISESYIEIKINLVFFTFFCGASDSFMKEHFQLFLLERF